MASGRRKNSGSAPPRRRSTVGPAASTLDRVREGVRRFILNDVSIGDFHKTLRAAIRNGEFSPHPLTGAAFRKIVKDVIEEKKRMSKQRTR